ncbi:MAG: hypothetical protein UT55_C0072G0011 [Candidatus Peregrinibacteria bacterium GW2011_GWE2_39_6]|nr:MAG: hypothetical protein UT36_C0006G0070 [Candidatus Peregrinibacteria bacterium GW2011_GWF2_39_17]KKR24113.1 MAG: hypothetical protein UT55_C0072G0011 [Candidatus Peregrinibacteria bacterium GW2011_GWE2_39_6]HCW32768.1 hypothetical protein [Candidatus Peregrinibacteria bacterium]
MKKFLPAIALLLLLSGCSANETAQTVFKELTEAYTNIEAKISDTKTWMQTKILQIEEAVNNVKQATNDVQEATDSVNNVLNSIQTVTDVTN